MRRFINAARRHGAKFYMRKRGTIIILDQDPASHLYTSVYPTIGEAAPDYCQHHGVEA